MSHLSIKDLHVYYEGVETLKGIDLEIPDKSIVAIIGPSGCGKTTLLRSINRLLELNSDVKVTGRVEIDGENIYDSKADLISLRKKMGFLSQRPFPLPCSIFDNVAYGPKIHRMDADAINAAALSLEAGSKVSQNRKEALANLVEICLKKAGLWEEVKERLGSPASRLSIGQQQRLSLARALAVGAEMILGDEPTSALDPISTKQIEEQFKALSSQYSIVMVTHILRQARRLADYVVFMYLGELIEHGPAEKIFNAPEKEMTRRYIKGDLS